MPNSPLNRLPEAQRIRQEIDSEKSSLSPQQVMALIDKKVGVYAAAAARATYIGTKMSDLPETYQEAMPVTSDPLELGLAEQKIRTAFRADMKLHAPTHARSMGWRPPGPQPGAAVGTSALGQPADLNKLTPSENILLGLRGSRAARGGAR
jgi:hypothetical protein